MQTFEFFVERPIKITINAENEEQAIAAVYQQLNLNPNDNVKITKPIIVEEEEKSNRGILKASVDFL
jgi:hypothetical protein